MITFNTSGQERMRIDSNGNFGIGTVLPDSKFPISANIHYTKFEHREHNGTIWYVIGVNSDECQKWIESQDPKTWAPVLTYYRIREDLYTYLTLKFAS